MVIHTANFYKNFIFIITLLNILFTLINIIILTIDLNSTSNNNSINKIRYQALTLLSVVILPTINILLIYFAIIFFNINFQLIHKIILLLIVIFYISMIGYGIYITYLFSNIDIDNVNDIKQYLVSFDILSGIHFLSCFILLYLTNKLK